jgi:hypothetical protein
MTETRAGALARRYPELGRREVKALAAEQDQATPEELAAVLAARLEDAREDAR